MPSSAAAATDFPPDALAFALAWPDHIPDLGTWEAVVDAADDGAEQLTVYSPTGGAYEVAMTAEGLVSVEWRECDGGRKLRAEFDDLRTALQAIRPMTPSALAAVETDALARTTTV